MHFVRIGGLGMLALAGAAEAEKYSPSRDCTGLGADSFEAAVLDCDVSASFDPRKPPTVMEYLGPVSASEQAPPGSLGYGEGDMRLTEAQGDGPVPAMHGLSGVTPTSGLLLDVPSDEETGAALQIPTRQRPPPGSCRIWFPDRHPGFQRAPTSCDVKVPDGAVLIRG